MSVQSPCATLAGMTHVIEPASSGRAKCRACEQKIAKGELRLGERLPNPYADGEMTLWYHPRCGALKRPEPFLQALESSEAVLENAADLEQEAKLGVEHRRLPRVNGAQRAPTGRARCRSCKELIPKDTWRIPLVFFESGRFEPSGFVHAGCASEYFGTVDVLARAQHFNPGLNENDLSALSDALK